MNPPTFSPSFISVEVIYLPSGAPNAVWRCLLTAKAPYTVEQAITESGILLQFPEIDLVNLHKVGIFGKIVSGHTLLKDQDRLEIYRPLTQDPKVLRIKRAQDQRKNGK
jgi:putative ubiquitin-RnfH superfamily antitoxin RatB of RatAB toxin-antitoxin module